MKHTVGDTVKDTVKDTESDTTMPGRRYVLLAAVVAAVVAGFSHVPGAIAQVPDSTSTDPIERVLETIESDELDAEQLVEFLTDLLKNPIDINTADRDALALVPGVDITLAHSIVTFREEAGAFSSVPELLLVPGVTEDLFLDIRPFLTIGSSELEGAGRRLGRPGLGELLRRATVETVQRYTRRIDVGRGYDSETTGTQYEGGPARVYSRLRATIDRRVSFNVTAEKDPGEAFEWRAADQRYGYDHVSIHLGLSEVGRIKSLVVGDFNASFGQGLVLWRGLAPGKGREVLSTALRSGSGIRPFGSSEENRFFRGVASSIYLSGSVVAHGMFSYRSLDATVGTNNETLEPVVTSLGSTGLHRTESELSRRDQVQETFFGGGLEWTGKRHRVGAIGYQAGFDIPFEAGTQPYQIHRFSGDAARVGSVFGHLVLGAHALYAEAAADQDGRVASTGGISSRFGRSVRAVISLRRYAPGFTNLHAFAFGESSGSGQNESGVYTGLQIRPSRTWRIAGYIDNYRFPKPRFGVAWPSSGSDGLVVVEHRPRRWISWYLQGRIEHKDAGGTGTSLGMTPMNVVRPTTRSSARAQLQYDFSPRLSTRTRLEVTSYDESGQQRQYGYLVMQDVRLLGRARWSLDLRAAHFDTDGFDARVYTYEYDLRYTFSVPAFSGQGERLYAMLNVYPVESLLLQMKYGVTRYEFVETVGSGLDQFDGDRVRELRFQLIWRRQ